MVLAKSHGLPTAPLALKDHSGSELDLPGWSRGGVQQPSRAGRLLIEAESAAEGIVVCWGLKVRMIEDVEGFHAKLKIERL